MVRDKRKTRKSNIIINLILILLISVSVGFSIYFYYVNNDNYNKEVTIKNELQTKKEEYNTLLLSNEELKQEKEKIENIDQSTKELKEEVFKLASTLEQKIKNKETKYKIAYLTFDDGPYYATNKFLDVLKKYHVKGTFFTIGLDKDKCFDNQSKDCSGMYKKIVENGHTIANHTYSHLIWKGLYSSANAFITQVQKQEKLIKDRTGVTTNIVRFPGGSGTANAFGLKTGITKKLKEINYGWVDWSAQDGDGGDLRTKEQALNNFKKSINSDIEVVLMHDYSGITLSVLPQFIEYLQERNYILLPLFYESVMVNK